MGPPLKPVAEIQLHGRVHGCCNCIPLKPKHINNALFMSLDLQIFLINKSMYLAGLVMWTSIIAQFHPGVVIMSLVNDNGILGS